MPDRAAIERAITELDILLREPGQLEVKFQAWFERHPVALAAYGYSRSLPHPVLTRGDAEYIPDFLVQVTDGVWEILELKRPIAKVLKDGERRRTFYAELEEYVAQCHDYRRCFEQDAFREAFNAQHGIAVQGALNTLIIAGRKQRVDLHETHRILVEERGGRVRLQTYDDVRDRLEFFRAQHYAQHEELPGLAVHLVFTPHKLQSRDNYILDFGITFDSDRISVYIDQDDRICLRILALDGTPYVVRIPLSSAFVLYEIPVYIVLELGLAREYSYVAIEVNGRAFAERRLDSLTLSEMPFRHWVLGSDCRGLEHTQMDVFEQVIVATTSTFAQRQQMREYIFDRYSGAFAGGLFSEPRLSFSGNQFLHTNKHPNFVPSSTGG